jgi:hypothetical protein
VLTACLPGFNEVMAPIVLATIGAFVVVNRRQPFASDRFMLTLLGIVVVLTAVCFAAPGNANRSGGYPALPSRHNLEFALAETARQTGRFLGRFGLLPALWLGALAAWWWGRDVLLRGPARLRRPAVLVCALAGIVSIIYLTLFPLYWEYGEVNYTGEGRTYNVTYVALCAMFVTGAVALSQLTGRFTRRSAGARARAGGDIAIAGALSLFLITSASTRGVFNALNAAPAYLKEEHARAHVLRTASPEGVVFVDRISARPPGLFWGDVESDETHWINICVAKFYRLASVRPRL